MATTVCSGSPAAVASHFSVNPLCRKVIPVGAETLGVGVAARIGTGALCPM